MQHQKSTLTFKDCIDVKMTIEQNNIKLLTVFKYAQYIN
jgi:hypothetical protein